MTAICTPNELAELADDLLSNRLLTTRQAAVRLGVREAQIRGWVMEGLLPAHRVGGRLIVLVSDLARWELRGLESLAATPELGAELLELAGGAA